MQKYKISISAVALLASILPALAQPASLIADAGRRDAGSIYPFALEARNADCQEPQDFRFETKNLQWLKLPQGNVVRQVKFGETKSIAAVLDFTSTPPGRYAGSIDILCDACGWFIFQTCHIDKQTIILKVDVTAKDLAEAPKQPRVTPKPGTARAAAASDTLSGQIVEQANEVKNADFRTHAAECETSDRKKRFAHHLEILGHSFGVLEETRVLNPALVPYDFNYFTPRHVTDDPVFWELFESDAIFRALRRIDTINASYDRASRQDASLTPGAAGYRGDGHLARFILRRVSRARAGDVFAIIVEIKKIMEHDGKVEPLGEEIRKLMEEVRKAQRLAEAEEARKKALNDAAMNAIRNMK